MTIDEAIEILADIAWNKDTLDEPDTQDAIKLGIQALKREQILRREVPYDRNGLLPGETK